MFCELRVRIEVIETNIITSTQAVARRNNEKKQRGAVRAPFACRDERVHAGDLFRRSSLTLPPAPSTILILYEF